MANKILIRRDTQQGWLNVNPILSQGEPGFEIDTNLIKVGDGLQKWTDLPYISQPELPPNAVGLLQNNGYGILSWIILPPDFSGSYTDLTNKPPFHPVSISGNYLDLNNTPFIPTDYNQLTDVNNILGNLFLLNSYADTLFKLDFGSIGDVTVTNRFEWMLNAFDIDNGTIISPANINFDAGSIV